MRVLFCFLSLFFFVQTQAQQLEFASANGKNSFYNFRREDPHNNSEYTSPGYVFSLGIAIDEIKIDSIPCPWRFEILYTHYNATFKSTTGGLGGASTVEATASKDLIGIGFYPLNFKIKELVKLNFGIQFDYLVHSRISGNESSWQMGQYSTNNEIDPKSNDYDKTIGFGFSSRIAFQIPINARFKILPYYQFFMGFSNEFRIRTSMKGMRNSLGVALALNI